MRHLSFERKISLQRLWRMSGRADKSSFHFLLAMAGGLTCASALAIGVTILWLRSDAIADASIIPTILQLCSPTNSTIPYNRSISF